MSSAPSCGGSSGHNHSHSHAHNTFSVGDTVLESSTSSSPSWKASPSSAKQSPSSGSKQPKSSPSPSGNTKRPHRLYSSINYSVQPNMNETTNVLMQYTLQDLAHRAEYNFWLALMCLAVCAVNIVLLLLNHALKQENNKPHVSHQTFHLLEFWTSFFYSVTEASALITSPKTMHTITKTPNLLKLLLFFNVVNSLVPAILMALDVEYFERLAHEMEFINEFTLSFISLILLLSLLNPNLAGSSGNLDDEQVEGIPSLRRSSSSRSDKSSSSLDWPSLIMGLLACGYAASTFVVYNFVNSHLAHYLEFTFNLVTALITFWFCMDNRFVAQMEISLVLYGNHKNCNFCQSRQSDYVLSRRLYSFQWQKVYGTTATSQDFKQEESRGVMFSGIQEESKPGEINELDPLLP